VLGINKKVSVLEVESEDFKDFNKYLGDFYKSYPTHFQNFHIFSCRKDMLDPSKLVVKLRKSNWEDTESIELDMIKARFFGRDRYPTGGIGLQEAIAARPAIMNIEKDPNDPDKECYGIIILHPTGIPDYKQVELYTNYRKYVPEKYKDITCPKPAESVLATIKNERAQRVKGKKIKKEETEKLLKVDKK
jgi:hypothetical protein